jgi:hypothetical protein
MLKNDFAPVQDDQAVGVAFVQELIDELMLYCLPLCSKRNEEKSFGSDTSFQTSLGALGIFADGTISRTC